MAGVDGVLQGDRLGVAEIDGLPPPQPEVEGIVHPLGALLGAGAAGDAPLRVHIAGVLHHLGPEVAGLPLQGADLAQGDELYVEMAAALHQLGGEDAGGAVVGGEGLVQLGHGAADGRGALHQVDEEAAVGQVQGRLDPGDPAAHHQHRTLGAHPLLSHPHHLTRAFSIQFQRWVVRHPPP